MTDTWDKYAITKCPGCGAIVLNNRADNVVVFECEAAVWDVLGFKPSLTCHERRIAQQARQITDLQHTMAELAERMEPHVYLAGQAPWERPTDGSLVQPDHRADPPSVATDHTII
jgi:hypothetical protein